jgi:PAS domain S-box-containing protein
METHRPDEKVNILLVDDRQENLLALEAMLESPLYAIQRARSGPEALKHLLRDDYAVILLDVMMPEMDGFEVARMIKQRDRSRHIPIIFLTAESTDISLIYKGYSVGAVDYLQKPVQSDVVKAKVAVLADLHRMAAQIRRQSELLQESERREREHQLAELRQASAKRYQNLADAIPQIVWTAAPDGAFEYLNRQWVDYTGMSPDQAVGRGWLEAVHPEDVDRCVAELRGSIASGASLELELRLRAASHDEHRWHLCRALPERKDGRIVAWLGTFTDIDDRKRDEEERARLYREAQEAIRVRDEFLSIASHELRTPITPLQLQLQAFLRSLKKGSPNGFSPEKAAAKLEVAARQLERLTKLIDELLDVARITGGRLTLERERVDLSKIVADVVARFAEQLERAECNVSVACPASAVGDWDPLRVEQIVVNLLSNAMKYAPGKPIEIAVDVDPHTARLCITDQGMGIARENLGRIFDRFERAVSARAYGGLGLGLYITRQIVDAHGGAIRVESEEGVGSTFTVELPIVRPPATLAPARPGA